MMNQFKTKFSAVLGIICAIAICNVPIPSKFQRLPSSAISLEVREAETWYLNRVPTLHPAEYSSIGKSDTTVDIRGVGDSAWTYPGAPGNRSAGATPKGFGKAVADLDPTHEFFNGDLNFINWESVVGTQCEKIRQSVDFYFLSSPDSVNEAIERGFNLFGLANNHAQDCNLGKAFPHSESQHGPLMTSEAFQTLARESTLPILWHGVGSPNSAEDPKRAKTATFDINGRKVRVAFAAIALLNWEIPNSATALFQEPYSKREDINGILASLASADVDLRILSLHTQDASGSRGEAAAFLYLKTVAERFVTEYNGDIVFGEGPHTWGGVRIFPKRNGRSGVVFTSLGNFIHQGLSANSDNYMARVILDRETFGLKEIQVVPFVNRKTTLKFYPSHAKTKAPRSNFNWQKSTANVNGETISSFSAVFR